jgi:Tol biopolymer transport system component
MMKKNAFWATCLLLLIVLLSCGCETPPQTHEQSTQRIKPLPPTAEILFLSNRDTGGRNKEIYTMDADGGHVTRITYTNEHHFLMGIDNTRINLVVTRADKDTENPKGLGDEDRKNLWIINLTTREETRLTDPDNLAEGDSFSPDGAWVVFWMVPKGEKTSDIYKIRPDGSGLTQLTNTPETHEFDPAWSHNGEKIAYNYYDTDKKRFVLNVMDADGKNVTTLYDGGAGAATDYFPPGNYDPSWSPDDQWIVFERAITYNEENGKGGIWHIFKVRSDGSGVLDLSETGGHNTGAEYLPSYSPDGKLIVFSSRYGPKDPAQVKINIFLMDLNGGSLKQLTDSPYIDDGAVWIK